MRGWMDSLVGPGGPPSARAEFIRSLQVIAVIGLLMVAGALWYLSRFGPLTLHMVVATMFGVFVSVLLGCGLFAAAFFSAKSGHDQEVTDATRTSFGASAARFPEGLESYRRTATFTQATVPAALLGDHDTRPGTWGLIHVVEGELRYCVTDARRTPCERILTPETAPGVVEPTIRHRVEPIGPVRFHVEFWRRPDPAG